MTRDLRQVLRDIYTEALRAVDPEAAVLRVLRRDGDRLMVAARSYDLRSFRRVLVVGFGKAGAPMARAVERVLGDRLEQGLVVVKTGHGGVLTKTRILEAGHPEPDEDGYAAALELTRFLEASLSEKDLLLVLVSGGGSALVPAPVAGVSLADKKETTSLLLKSGATIHEINAVRKHLSRLKGGRLLVRTKGAQVVALVISDVVGDDISSIASGPTVPDPTTFADCLAVVRKYGLESSLPSGVLSVLERGAAGDPETPETLKPGDPIANRAQNEIVASNSLALESAAKAAATRGFRPLILSSSIQGDTAEVARMHVALAREVYATGHPARPPCCLISGGETTVKVTGSGKGGRNQEFALWCAGEIAGWPHDALFASLGTDGTDGPTDAAGAMSDPETRSRAARLGLSISDSLARNDSYGFFKPLGDLIVTGPTRTNVMDLRLILLA
jgi:glycerate 2-kinase